MRGQVTSGVRGWPFPGSSPSQALASCLRMRTDGSDQSLTPLYSCSLEGPARAPGTPQEGTSLLPRPASCPFLGSNWTADPRENHHLGLPGTARHPWKGGRRDRGPREEASRGPGRGGEEGWESHGPREGGRGKDRGGGMRGNREVTDTRGGRDENQEGGERDSERGPDKSRSSRTEKGRRGKREGGEWGQ